MDLPIHSILPQLQQTLRSSTNVVLCAPPGAGKTTQVPIALLNADWMHGKKILMLEPRRLAARRSAEFMATTLGEGVGETIGYRTRGDSRISGSTRIEVLTEGVLTRILHDQPDLPGTGIIIFDEFHERSINADLGLALALDIQHNLREDLRVLVMSATLDGAAVSELMNNAPIIESRGRSFAVETNYLPHPSSALLEHNVVDAIRKALQNDTGNMLVFLPGQREIRKVEALLHTNWLPSEVVVRTLYGEASDEQQRSALAPAPEGKRTIILSTNIAETSLTIDGIRIVVDAGLARSSQFDPRRGMAGLVTGPVSQAAADQRRGRAGRQQPGICYRLWTESQHATLPRYSTPEILVTDLAPLALDLALWGVRDAGKLRFLNQPPTAHLAQSRTLLKSLGALDEQETITRHGRELASLPIHPRLAHMVIRGNEMGCGVLACDVAAILEERDLLRGQQGVDIDLTSRWQALQHSTAVDRAVQKRVGAESRRLQGILGIRQKTIASENMLGPLLALAYPERIARRRSKEGRRYQMSGGTGAVLPEPSNLVREEFLAIAEVDGAGTEARVFLAAPLGLDDITELFDDRITTKQEVFWNEQQEIVVARKARYLNTLIISEQSTEADEEAIQKAMMDGISAMGLRSLPWSAESESLRQRNEWLRLHCPVADDWPVLDDDTLLKTLDIWLAPFLAGMTKRSDLKSLNMVTTLKSQFSHAQLKELERFAPSALQIPTGSYISLDYSSGDQPVLAVRLQEMFGLMDTPTVAGGRIKVVIHLLSPAGRPLAVTQDLSSFWRNAYPEVRKQVRGRYPKHYWPENPLVATPTRKTGKNRPQE